MLHIHYTLQRSQLCFCTTPDIPPPANHLLHSLGSSEISLRWSSSFTSQYAVERYRVSVNPDPSSCSSDQVSPSEDYSCSGLVLGTRYTFTVSAINCGDQEGERESFTINITIEGIGVNLCKYRQWLIQKF